MGRAGRVAKSGDEMDPNQLSKHDSQGGEKRLGGGPAPTYHRIQGAAGGGALSPSAIGGGVNANVVAGRIAGIAEKRHLVLKRWFAGRAAERGCRFIDLGTDYSYPFYEGFAPTAQALAAILENVGTARTYPSSYGIPELRGAFVAFMDHRFAVALDPNLNVMVTPGASQVFDAVSRMYAGPFVLVPHLALSTVTSIAIGNGAEIVRIPMGEDLRPDLKMLDAELRRLGEGSVRFIYINSPLNPAGVVLSMDYLCELVFIARRHQVLVLHDHDSWFTTHRGPPSVNILEVPGAFEIAITVLSVSKELGLPGIRVGLVAGNQAVINDLRIHNSEFCVMIPEFCQAAAAAALRATIEGAGRGQVQLRIDLALRAAVEGWKRLGWPRDALRLPAAGYKFLLRPPPAFMELHSAEVAGVELFDFLIARDAFAKLSTSRSFNPECTAWIRMVIMQDAGLVVEFFDRLQAIGVHYEMAVPAGLLADFMATVAECGFWSL